MSDIVSMYKPFQIHYAPLPTFTLPSRTFCLQSHSFLPSPFVSLCLSPNLLVSRFSSPHHTLYLLLYPSLSQLQLFLYSLTVLPALLWSHSVIQVICCHIPSLYSLILCCVHPHPQLLALLDHRTDIVWRETEQQNEDLGNRIVQMVWHSGKNRVKGTGHPEMKVDSAVEVGREADERSQGDTWDIQVQA